MQKGQSLHATVSSNIYHVKRILTKADLSLITTVTTRHVGTGVFLSVFQLYALKKFSFSELHLSKWNRRRIITDIGNTESAIHWSQMNNLLPTNR